MIYPSVYSTYQPCLVSLTGAVIDSSLRRIKHESHKPLCTCVTSTSTKTCHENCTQVICITVAINQRQIECRFMDRKVSKMTRELTSRIHCTTNSASEHWHGTHLISIARPLRASRMGCQQRDKHRVNETAGKAMKVLITDISTTRCPQPFWPVTGRNTMVYIVHWYEEYTSYPLNKK